MTEFIINECLLPSLVIGVPEEVFWKKTPKTLAVYFKAYRQRQEEEAKRWSQKAWEMGQYVRAAISTSIFPAGLYDGKHKLPDYPKCPHIELENNLEDLTEEQKQNERMRLYNYLKSFSKK